MSFVQRWTLVFIRKKADGSENAHTVAAIPTVNKEYKARGTLAANPAIFRVKKANQNRLTEIRKKTKISPVTNPDIKRMISAQKSRTPITAASNITYSPWHCDSLSKRKMVVTHYYAAFRDFRGFCVSVTHYYVGGLGIHISLTISNNLKLNNDLGELNVVMSYRFSQCSPKSNKDHIQKQAKSQGQSVLPSDNNNQQKDQFDSISDNKIIPFDMPIFNS